MSEDSRFLHHEGCPSCGSKDNVGVYSDGHKWCFGCGWKDPGTKTISAMKSKVDKLMGGQTNVDKINFTPENYTYEIPLVGRQWLKKYGIMDHEIKEKKLMWNKQTSSLVFPVYSKGELKVTNERYFGNDPMHSKYVTRGPKNQYGVILAPHKAQSNVLIMTEDYVSAMKVSRQFLAMPLLGADIAVGTLISVSKATPSLRVWLDRDKATKSLQEASRASQYMTGSVRSIITELDPKEYQDEEIKEIIEGTL
jgi:hypothetical protein